MRISKFLFLNNFGIQTIRYFTLKYLLDSPTPPLQKKNNNKTKYLLIYFYFFTKPIIIENNNWHMYN